MPLWRLAPPLSVDFLESSDGGRHGRLGGVPGLPGGVRGVVVGVRLALQGEDAAQPADEGGGADQEEEAAALAGKRCTLI